MRSVSGTLSCAYSEYGTPTETSEQAACPYRLLQVSSADRATLQISVSDEESNGERNEVYTVAWKGVKSEAAKNINGLMLGPYVPIPGQKCEKYRVSLEIRDQKIVLIAKAPDGKVSTYFCEVPGQYEKDYSNWVESGVLKGW